jgi:hypothetical protein
MLIRACYAEFVRDGEPSPEQVYALCKLTWIIKAKGRIVDNTRSVVAPALSSLLGVEFGARSPDELTRELRRVRAPEAVLTLSARPVGIVNYHRSFRNTARTWLRQQAPVVTRIVTEVVSGGDCRAAYGRIARLPTLPRPGAGDGKPRNLLTPLLACLDARGRSPIINDRVTGLLRRLGRASSSLEEQYDGLTELIGLAGIDDAFAIDTIDDDDIVRALTSRGKRVSRRRKPTNGEPDASGGKPLVERRDDDVEFIREADVVKMRRRHNSMTNAVRMICARAGLVAKEGSADIGLFDVLVHAYRGTERHLLIEVKTDDSPAMVRLAVGQLLDYRRLLEERAATDLAALFPAEPSRDARDFLAHVGVKVVWFADDAMSVTGGDVILGAT